MAPAPRGLPLPASIRLCHPGLSGDLRQARRWAHKQVSNALLFSDAKDGHLSPAGIHPLRLHRSMICGPFAFAT